MVRIASEDDVARLIALAEAKRAQYEAYAPTFWRPAPDAAEKQTVYFRTLLNRANTLCLVHEESGAIDGFLIAAVVPAPLVYDPGSLVCMVDDFAVASPERWETVGRELLREARRSTEALGAKLAVVVCGHRDEAKHALLRSEGLFIASEWYVSG